MNAKCYIAAFFMLFTSLFAANAQSVIRGPYLQMVTTNSIYIQWRTSSSTNSRVWYGTDPDNLNQIVNSGTNVTNHSILITGLNANTTYYYAVGNSNGQMEGGTINHYFNTSPPSNTDQTIKVWALGNAGNDIDDQTTVRNAFYNYIGNEHIDVMLLLGDNAYLVGTDAQYQEHWFEMYDDRLINSVMWSCYGNRDANSANSQTQSGPYYDIFNFPKNAQAGGVASGTEAYYSFDYGNIHFISINSEDDYLIEDVGGPMYNWIVNDINSTDKDWIVVMFHHPPYNGGGGPNGPNGSDTHDNETIMRENVLPILEAAGVDLVLGSHHHTYQRSYFINGHYDDSDTFDPNTMGVDMGDGRLDGDGAYTKEIGDIGTVYIVAGSAGSVSSDPCCHPVMYAPIQSLGSVSIEVTELQMDVKFVQGNGAIGDYFTIIKTPSGAPTVNITYPANDQFFSAPEPIVITATATDNNGTISHVDFFVDDNFIGSDNTFPYTKNWTIPDNGSYVIKATAVDNDNLTASTEVVIQVGLVTVSSSITASSDDAEQNKNNNNVNLTSSDLEMMTDGGTPQLIGLRFTNLNIPQGAYIESAFIQFTADNNSVNDPLTIEIYGQDSDNSFTFGGNNNIGSRPKTSAMVEWSPANWVSHFDRGDAQKTPDISSVIQEIVNRPGYNSNSAIGIIIDGFGNGMRKAFSYDGDPDEVAEITVTYSLSAPLPIELLDFNAKALDKKVKLNWTTATETNNDFFSLERSADGSAFREIAIIPGQGTTTAVHHYEHFDLNPQPGLNYYRLKQTDFDGKYSFSKVVSAEFRNGYSFRVYPSVVNDVITVEKDGNHKEAINIKIHDLLGRTYESLNFSAEIRSVQLPLMQLAPGTYFLTLNDSHSNETFIFIKI